MMLAARAASPTEAARTYCGVRSGTAGNAYLDARNSKDSLTLAEQGGSQVLLDQIDTLVGPYKGETGTQNGQRYCAVVKLDRSGKPAKVVKAWRQQR
jgi:hypothetical protein